MCQLDKTALTYDICSTPDGMTLERVVRVWKEHDFILYDSEKGTAPVLLDPENSKAVLVDMSNLDVEKLIKIQKLINDE